MRVLIQSPDSPAPQVPSLIEARPLPGVVIDTNVVLDLWLFDHPDVACLRQALVKEEVRWLASERMFDELERVLKYPHLQAKLQVHLEQLATPLHQAMASLKDGQANASHAPFQSLEEVAQGVICCMAHWARRLPTAKPSLYKCKDRDDQVFVDLASEHQATLLSKDKAVLKLKNRLARVGARVVSAKDSSEWLQSIRG
jgi:predicted nucleic acid-binding protein